MTDISDAQLDRVNAERLRRGLPPLTKRDALDKLRERAYQGDDPSAFLISIIAASVMTTESAFGVVPRAPAPPPETPLEGGGGSSGGAGASGSFDADSGPSVTVSDSVYSGSSPDASSTAADAGSPSPSGDAGGSSSPSGGPD